MSSVLVDSLKTRSLRNRILYTLALLGITRIGAYIPIPGVNPAALLNASASSGSALGFLSEYLDFFSGGAFSNFSILMLGVMPYISAEIIGQLLMIIIPRLKEMAKDPSGQARLQRWMRYGTILVCVIQSYAVVVYSREFPGLLTIGRGWFALMAAVSCAAGSMFMVWLGERITQKGVGNGISLLIFAGIVARIPSAIGTLITGVRNDTMNIVSIFVMAVIFFAVVVMIIYEEKGERRIYVTYSKRIIGNKIYGAQSSHIPFKLNPSGVIPVIFASAILSFPLQIAASLGPDVRWLNRFASWLNPQGVPYIVLHTVLIILFAFFYTQVTLNPIEIAKQIRENGGTIRGVRVDKMEEYLTKILNRIILPGSLFLAFIALLPTLIQLIFRFPANVSMLLGGTSLLIMVGVELDTARSIEGLVKSQNRLVYSGNRSRSL